MNEAVEFVQENWVSISAGLGLLLAAAGIVVKMTKTKKDDEALGFIERILAMVGIRRSK